MGTFRAEERRTSSRNVPGGEERGDTDVFEEKRMFSQAKFIQIIFKKSAVDLFQQYMDQYF